MGKVLELPLKKEKAWKKAGNSLLLHIPSGVYYVRKKKKGKGALFKTTGSKKITVARDIADELIKEFQGRKPGIRNERVSIPELCDLVYKRCLDDSKTLDSEGHPLRRIRTLEKDRSFLQEKTRMWKDKSKVYPAVIKSLFGDYFADEIDEVFWKNWTKREGRRLDRNIGDIAKYLSMVLSYAYENQYIGRKPVLINPDKHKRKAVRYSDEQVLAFFNAAEPTLQDLIVIGSENPLRPHENREVQWDMVRISNGSDKSPTVIYDLPAWFVKKGARSIKLTPNAAHVVIKRYKEREKLSSNLRSPYVFPAPKSHLKPIGSKMMSRMWHRMKETAGIADEVEIYFHWFRHNVYRRLLKIHGLPIASVSQVGGTSVSTLQKHYDIEEEEAQLQVADAISLPFFKVKKEIGCEKSVKNGEDYDSKY